MRILHTSDWHIGRSFHRADITDDIAAALAHIAQLVSQHEIDAVVIAGDVFDHSNPAARYFSVLQTALGQIRAAGAQIIMISGNHDSAERLTHNAQFAAFGGVHIIGSTNSLETPVALEDAHGTVEFFGIPYLEPVLNRDLLPEGATPTHQAVLSAATSRIKAALTPGARSVVLAHAFVTNQATSPVEGDGLNRDITAGGLDLVAADTFAGFDYVALGHLHGRQMLTERIRYSGAPVYFSFGEVQRARGVWIVDLDADGFADAKWVDLPIARNLLNLRGTLQDVIALGEAAAGTSAADIDVAATSVIARGWPKTGDACESWVSVTYTDRVPPAEPMRKLREVWPHCVVASWEAPDASETEAETFAQRQADAKTPAEVISGFLEFVRDGKGADAVEQQILATAVSTANAGASSTDAAQEPASEKLAEAAG